MDGPAPEFDWDEGNREKCRAHGLSISDIEHVLERGETLIVPDAKHSLVEARLIAIGRVPSGRYAFVVFTPKKRGGATVLRPISARFMHQKEFKKYEKEIPRAQDR